MTNNDFFDDTKQEESEKIKLGDQEFSPDELTDLIGAGKKLKELEEKQGQPIDDVLSSWGKRGEVIGELKKTKEELERELDKYKNPPTKDQIDTEAAKRQVQEELKSLGFASKEELMKEFNDLYNSNRSTERLLSQVKKVSRESKSDGKPAVEVEELLQFMADPNNPRDPEKAYKVMKEKELEIWKEERINQAKKPGIPTVSKSSAGNKSFEAKRPGSKEELRSSLTAAIFGEGGAQ